MSSGKAESSEEKLQRLHEIILGCHDCELSRARKVAVPGEGDFGARVVFVGEAPGAREDEQGRPFCGPAGQLLDELLASIGLPRESVYITNIVKCRPPGNRVPTSEEVAACNEYLKLQVGLIAPKVLCTLGGPALSTLTGETRPIGKWHGKPERRKRFTLYPLYHPAAALHQPSLRDTLYEDFGRLGRYLEEHS